ncbi:MAG TPA: O-acetyl-ADP-ribose deacetylase [Tepidisphaeraceae bacterium]|jgi:O-acetyl-ADP-ribose deacetylase (regulator of RNase III)|nr:O-acetyl-ADP-ribose deacetylase [Tepidisphaeraceae bacterium]
MQSQALIEVVEGDITDQVVDAIVNAANEGLMGGGGVDGAIHDAAGPKLAAECRKLRGCPTGQARITGGYNLPAKYVIHTVGPVWRGGSHNEVNNLCSCYKNSLLFAHMQGLESIAFPCISTGAFRFPRNKAAHAALLTTANFLNAQPESSIKTVRFVCFEPDDFKLYFLMLGRRHVVKAAGLKLSNEVDLEAE